MYTSEDCSRQCSCENGVLNCMNYEPCDENAVCSVKNGVRDCFCNNGYQGNGTYCERGECIFLEIVEKKHDNGRKETIGNNIQEKLDFFNI